MAGTATEERLINKLQGHYEAISDIKTAYPFAENPDQLSRVLLPATIFYPARSESGIGAHHNQWRNIHRINAVTFVIERQAAGGKLKFLENKAITLMQAIRARFQTKSVVEDILGVGLSAAYTFDINYGAGGLLLTHMGVEYIGVITSFRFTEIG